MRGKKHLETVLVILKLIVKPQRKKYAKLFIDK